MPLESPDGRRDRRAELDRATDGAEPVVRALHGLRQHLDGRRRRRSPSANVTWNVTVDVGEAVAVVVADLVGAERRPANDVGSARREVRMSTSIAVHPPIAASSSSVGVKSASVARAERHGAAALVDGGEPSGCEALRRSLVVGVDHASERATAVRATASTAMRAVGATGDGGARDRRDAAGRPPRSSGRSGPGCACSSASPTTTRRRAPKARRQALEPARVRRRRRRDEPLGGRRRRRGPRRQPVHALRRHVRRSPAELDRRRPPGARRAARRRRRRRAARARARPSRPVASAPRCRSSLVNDGPVTVLLDR